MGNGAAIERLNKVFEIGDIESFLKGYSQYHTEPDGNGESPPYSPVG